MPVCTAPARLLKRGDCRTPLVHSRLNDNPTALSVAAAALPKLPPAAPGRPPRPQMPCGWKCGGSFTAGKCAIHHHLDDVSRREELTFCTAQGRPDEDLERGSAPSRSHPQTL